MKKFVSFIAVCLIATSAGAVTGRTGRSMTSQMAPGVRATASVNQLSAMAAVSAPTTDKSSIRDEEPVATVPATPEVVDKREKEKAACLGNNIGIGNTFVWASRYSNVNNYASMVEDVENPENNTCFVKVELKSDDARISVADIPAQYYEMGRDITCGAWTDEGKLEKRILDAKKTARTWATVGGAVGGAGIGVGAMELFGNKLINGKVEGQDNKKLSETERLRSQLLVLQKEDKVKYNKFMQHLKTLEQSCDASVWQGVQGRPEECTTFEETYKPLLTSLGVQK